MSSRLSMTRSHGSAPGRTMAFSPIPVVDMPRDMPPKRVDRAKIKAGRKTARRNRRKRA